MASKIVIFFIFAVVVALLLALFSELGYWIFRFFS